METSDLAWLAGILEGEGTFGVLTSHVGGKQYRYPKIAVNMTDRDIIERVARLFPNGGGVYDMPAPKRFPDRLPQFRAQVSGRAAAELMRELRPWMGQRRTARIDEILREYDAREPTAPRRRRSCSEAAADRPRRPDGTFVAIGV